MHTRYSPTPVAAAAAALLTALALPAAAASDTTMGTTATPSRTAAVATPVSKPKDEAAVAARHVAQALATVEQMSADPQLKQLMRDAKGVFVVPDYGRAAFVVGGQGGAGVLLVHRNGTWTGPAFYNMGGISIGAQAGVAGGKIALILRNDKALQAFGTDNKFSLNSDAGLTFVDYSKRAHGAAGRGDIVMWSSTKGAFANASVSITDVNYDGRETQAYYGHAIDPGAVVDGLVASDKADRLRQAMPT